MAASQIQRFIDALQQLEQSGDLNPMVEGFADDCVIKNLVIEHEIHGKAAARRYWANYRATFGELRSTFLNIVSSGSRAALEWRTEGALRDGTPVVYEGTSILEFDGDSIARFVAYFDPRKVGRSIEEALHPAAVP